MQQKSKLFLKYSKNTRNRKPRRNGAFSYKPHEKLNY